MSAARGFCFQGHGLDMLHTLFIMVITTGFLSSSRAVYFSALLQSMAAVC